MCKLYRSLCQLVIWSYTIEDNAVSPLTCRKYSLLNGNFVFSLHDLDLGDFLKNVTLV